MELLVLVPLVDLDVSGSIEGCLLRSFPLQIIGRQEITFSIVKPSQVKDGMPGRAYEVGWSEEVVDVGCIIIHSIISYHVVIGFLRLQLRWCTSVGKVLLVEVLHEGKTEFLNISEPFDLCWVLRVNNTPQLDVEIALND